MFQITTTFNHNTELLTDSIHPFFFGIESCTQSHSYGPRTRDYILIHFVLAGSGFVTYNDEIPFKVTAHEAFIIPANISCHSSFVPYLDSSGEFATEKLHLATDSDVSFFFEMSSALFKILAVLSAPCRFTDSYNTKRVSEIKQYLDLYYNKSLRIQDIANEFMLLVNCFTHQIFQSKRLHIRSDMKTN